MKRLGFQSYPSDDEDLIEEATLLDASNIGSATASGTVTYSSDGVKVGSNTKDGSYLEWDISSMSFDSGIHFTFEVEKTMFALDVQENSDDSGLFKITDGTNIVALQKLVATHYWAVVNNGVALSEQAYCDNRDVDSHIKVTVVLKEWQIDVYFDRFLVIHENLTDAIDLSLATFRLGGDGDATYPNIGMRIKNVQFVDREVDILPDWRLRSITGIGDSFIRNGQYGFNNQHTLGYQGTENTSQHQALVGAYDRNMFTAIQRNLALNNYFVSGERIKFYGRGGCRCTDAHANSLQVRNNGLLSTAVNTIYPSPGFGGGDIIFCFLGANDAFDGVTGAKFQSSYEAEIARWDAAGYSHIFICEPIPRRDADYTSEISSYRTAVNTLPSYNSKVHVVGGLWQTFNDAGVFGASGSLYNSDDIHPNMSGNIVIGDAIANAIRKHVLKLSGDL